MKRSILAAMACLAMLPGAAGAQSVVTYHNSPARTGAFTVPGLTLAAAATMHQDAGFKATVTGSVYAQPLYWKPSGAATGLLIVATESNVVYALNANTGAQVWMTQLATPLPNPSSHPVVACGDIDPEGVTGTPVIDPATGTLYLDAMTVQGGNVPRQMIYALSLSTGKVLPNWPLDVDVAMAARNAAFASLVEGERSALQFFGGKVYVNYAGRAGDCGSYHGAVIEVTPAGPTISGSWETRALRGGIWSQGGVASDGKSMFVTTGNTSAGDDWQDGEAVLRLAPGLAHSGNTKDYFTPLNWKALDNGDLDIGGTMAVPFTVPASPSGTVPRLLGLGKDGHAYLLNAADLGGIGHALANMKVSNSEIVTAPAIYQGKVQALVAFTNSNGISSACSGNNLTMLRVTSAAQHPVAIGWCAPFNGGGAPVITTTDGSNNPIAWVVGAQGDDELHGFNLFNGKPVFTSASTVHAVHHFGTLIAANRRLYIPADGTIYAFTF